MSKSSKKSPKGSSPFGAHLGFGQLSELATELQGLRQNPPKISSTPGSRAGDILGFVRGLRISARLAYFLRDRLSSYAAVIDVSWGHLLDDNENLASCSPECDIIIHAKGFHRRWNGGERPLMDFCFIKASAARSVVSCKATLTSIDKKYPKAMKEFGVAKVFLFAECCEQSAFARMKAAARKAGYSGLYCLYFTKKGQAGFQRNENLYVEFVEAIEGTIRAKGAKP